MPDFKSVEDTVWYLVDLGDCDEIAESMRRRGIKSKPACPESCAVAEFISVTVGTYSVTVDGEQVVGFYGAHYECDYEIPDGPFRVEIPETVREFIVAFDCGKYPDLFANVWREAYPHLYPKAAA